MTFTGQTPRLPELIREPIYNIHSVSNPAPQQLVLLATGARGAAEQLVTPDVTVGGALIKSTGSKIFDLGVF